MWREIGKTVRAAIGGWDTTLRLVVCVVTLALATATVLHTAGL